VTETVVNLRQDGSRIVCLRSEHLEVDVAPQEGGRIVGIRHPGSGHEFLGRNSRLRLQAQPPGSEYDPNLYGGIDELLPNDIPETIDGVACSDHGELWTRSLDWRIDGQSLLLEGEVPRCGLSYQRRMRLRAGVFANIDIVDTLWPKPRSTSFAGVWHWNWPRAESWRTPLPLASCARR
jgi:hypothetical protein